MRKYKNFSYFLLFRLIVFCKVLKKILEPFSTPAVYIIKPSGYDPLGDSVVENQIPTQNHLIQALGFENNKTRGAICKPT